MSYLDGTAYNAQGWTFHMQEALGFKLDMAPGGNFGNGAENTALIAQRAVQDATQAQGWGAGIAMFLGPFTNDSALSVADTIPNLTTIFEASHSRGMVLVAGDDTPKNNEGHADHQARRACVRDEEARRAQWPNYILAHTSIRFREKLAA